MCFLSQVARRQELSSYHSYLDQKNPVGWEGLCALGVWSLLVWIFNEASTIDGLRFIDSSLFHIYWGVWSTLCVSWFFWRLWRAQVWIGTHEFAVALSSEYETIRIKNEVSLMECALSTKTSEKSKPKGSALRL